MGVRSLMASNRLQLAQLLILLLSPFLFGLSSGQNCGSQGGGALCQTGYCCSIYGYCGTSDAYCASGNCQSQCPSSPSSGSGVAGIISSSTFDLIFPNRNSFYTYDSFISAASSFGSFGTTGDSTQQTRDIAAFFANVYHETSGLYYINEIDQAVFCEDSTQYPCAAGQEYYGRGPLQLTWNFNYGPAGDAIGQDLLDNPDLVATDPTISFQTALWFWTTVQSPKPSCESVMDGTWSPSATDVSAGREPGFGLTIDIINGGIECGSGATNPSAASDRVTQYQNICSILSVDPGSYLDCTDMQPY